MAKQTQNLETPASIWRFNNFPNFQSLPNGQYVVGKGSMPIQLQVTLLNAAALNVDLTTRGAWFTDRRVAAGFAIASAADAQRIQATLSVSAIGLKVVGFSDANAGLWTNAQKLLLNATEPYIRTQGGSTPYSFSLKRGISHYIRRFESDQGTAADEIVGTLDQGYSVLPSPLRINLSTDTFSLVSDSAVALGADVTATLEILGMITPLVDGWGTQLPNTGACGDLDNEPMSERMSSIRDGIALDAEYQRLNVR